MSLHTGIEPSKEIDVLELNLPSKKYVDDELKKKIYKAGDTFTGPLSMNSGKIWDLSSGALDTNAVNKKYVDDADNLKLAKTGGIILGELSMDDNKITDLATPTDNNDAANKKYVDGKIPTVPNGEHYMIFEFPSTRNNVSIQSKNLTGFIYFTNNCDIKLTVLAHVMDDDQVLSNLNLYYWVRHWTKAKVQKGVKNTSRKTNVNEYPSVQGSSLQTFGIFENITLTDISAFTLYYRYFHTQNLGNESSVHWLIEYI